MSSNRQRTLAIATATLFLAWSGHRGAAMAQQRVTASGSRLLTFTQRVGESEGDRHALRTRLPEAAIARGALRCAALRRGRQFGVPVPLSDGTLALITQSPGGVAWFADGQLVRQVEVPGAVYGTAIEGADGRVIVVDDSPSIRAFAPDGSLRAVLPLPSRPLYGASSLSDGTLLVPIESAGASEVAVLSPDLSQLSRVRLGGTLANAYFYHGAHGSLWFNTNNGPQVFDGVRAIPETISWARGSNAAWQTDEDTVVVQFGTGSPTELRFASRAGVTRGTVMLHGQIFLLPRGHVALTQPHYADPANTTTTGTTTGTSAATGTTSTTTAGGTVTVGPRPPPRPPIGPPYPRFGLGALSSREQTHTEVTLYDRRGAQIARALIPPQRPLAVLMDPDGALLVMLDNGHAIHVDPGGTVRWDSNLGVTPEQDVIALPQGGFAMTVQRPRPGVCTVEP